MKVEGRRFVHPILYPPICTREEVEGLTMKRACGHLLSTEEWKSLGYQDCIAVYGERSCPCGQFINLDWES